MYTYIYICTSVPPQIVYIFTEKKLQWAYNNCPEFSFVKEARRQLAPTYRKVCISSVGANSFYFSRRRKNGLENWPLAAYEF
jgi:hypothetical protein